MDRQILSKAYEQKVPEPDDERVKKIRIASVVALLALISIGLLLFLRRSAPPLSTPSPAASKPVATKASALQLVESRLAVAPIPPHAEQRKSAAPPEPLAAAGQRAPLVTVDSWQNAGKRTIGAAVQSQFWAIATGDTDYLQRSTLLDAGVKTALEEMMSSVPDTVRAQYPTPEGLAAFLLSSRPALRGYALSMRTELETGETKVNVMTILPGAPRFDGERQTFRQAQDGEWYRVIGISELSRWREMIKWDRELSLSRKWATPKSTNGG